MRVGLLILITGLTLSSPVFGEAALVQGTNANGSVAHTYSYDQSTGDIAAAHAMQNCNRSAFNCYVARQFNSTCFAMAYSETGGYGYAFADDIAAQTCGHWQGIR